MKCPAYRDRLYAAYAANFADARIVCDPTTAARFGKAYGYYLRGWLPSRRDAPIADVACGDGKLLRYFKSEGFISLAGVDLSPTQVEQARQAVEDVELGDACGFLDRRPCSFDLVTCIDMVEHLEKDEAIAFFDSCHRALKPGGRLILQTPNCETPMGVVVRFSDFTHESGFGPCSIGQVLRACGFEQTAFRELGPVPVGYSVASTLRFFLWGGLRILRAGYNLVESGDIGSGVLSRVFLASAIKPGNV